MLHSFVLLTQSMELYMHTAEIGMVGENKLKTSSEKMYGHNPGINKDTALYYGISQTIRLKAEHN